jgi:hypothetical protein
MGGESRLGKETLIGPETTLALAQALHHHHFLLACTHSLHALFVRSKPVTYSVKILKITILPCSPHTFLSNHPSTVRHHDSWSNSVEAVPSCPFPAVLLSIHLHRPLSLRRSPLLGDFTINERGRDDLRAASLPKYKPHFRTLKTPFVTDDVAKSLTGLHVTAVALAPIPVHLTPPCPSNTGKRTLSLARRPR